jgi:D-arabinose 1-dehydrogenase-like Zn-dependent alcohol dehydrogenase
MRGAVMYGPGDVRVEGRDEPRIVEPADAIIRVSAACVCGSDLWPYRGIGVGDDAWPMPMGHEYVGIVEEVGDDVATIRPGQFVVGSFWASDNTCAICRGGYQSACVNRVPMGALGAQADFLRVPLADGTLVATPDVPSDDLIPSLLSASDVLGTGWFAAVAAEAGPGKTVAVVGDGAVGLLAVLGAKQLGAQRIIAMSRHEDPAAPGARVRRDRHRRGTQRRRGRADQGADRRARRTLGRRGCRHTGVDDAGAPRDQARRARRLRRRQPRRGLSRHGLVLEPRAPARRAGPGAPLPARADRADLEPRD